MRARVEYRHTWGGVGRDEGNAVGGGGALSSGLDNEVLVSAGEAREPVQHLQSSDTTPRHIRRLRLDPGEAGSKGVALTGTLDAGDGGR